MVILCVTFAIVRSTWLWPISVLGTRNARQAPSTLTSITAVLAELIPLPIALLTAATFTRLGWSFFLLLVYVFVGLGALMRQMLVKMHELQDRIDTIELTGEITQAIAQAEPDIGALCALAHRLCQRFVPLPKFELGLYDNTYTNVNIQVSVNNNEKLPPMRIPITPQWEWLSERDEPHLVLGKALLDQLPFSLSPIGKDQAPESAIFVPIAERGEQGTDGDQETSATAVGGIVLLSPHPNAFSERDVARIALVADLIGSAIHRIRP